MSKSGRVTMSTYGYSPKFFNNFGFVPIFHIMV